MMCRKKKYYLGRKLLPISKLWALSPFKPMCMGLFLGMFSPQIFGEGEGDPTELSVGTDDASHTTQDIPGTSRAEASDQNKSLEGSLRNSAADKKGSPTHGSSGVGAQGYLSTVSGLVFVHADQQPLSVIQEIVVREGDHVQKGQLLARLSTYSLREIEKNIALEDFHLAKCNAKIAENKKNALDKQWQRNQKLRSSRAISEQELEKIEKEFTESKIDMERMAISLRIAQQKLHLAHAMMLQSVILSPMEGDILSLEGKVGEKVSDRDGLLMMADLSQIEVVAEVHENDISKISLGQRAEISLPNQALTMIGQVIHKAGIVYSNQLKNADPKGSQDLRVVEVRLKLNPEDAKKVRDFLRMHVDVRFFPEHKVLYDTRITQANEARAL